jgi:hypothetical protein
MELMTMEALTAQLVILDIVTLVKDHPYIVMEIVQNQELTMLTILDTVYAQLISMMIMVNVKNVPINVLNVLLSKFVILVLVTDLWKTSVSAQVELLMTVRKFAQIVESNVMNVFIPKKIVLFVQEI